MNPPENARAPKYYREQFREPIKARKVVLGMWPREALLAAGGGVYIYLGYGDLLLNV